MIKLVACDMAGTTIDEHGDVYVALARAVEETGAATTAEAVQEWMGADKVEAITALIERGGGTPAPDTVRNAFARFKQLLADSYAANPPVPLTGVEDAIRELQDRGIKVALTTGFSRDVAEPLLAGLGWTVADDGGSIPGGNGTAGGSKARHGIVLDAVVCADDVAAGRPAPYMIHRTMELTGVQDVREVLAAGDTANDLLAATRAGVTAVGVLTGKLNRAALAQYPHQHILDGVRNIPAILPV
ncbi:phosphonatase-like hydrolase [Arthrobacter sp. B10-11]|uniref:phosphonatase-like hydrolase n=1 Tax=Arthrobacter sp. B10-11 TaxID=3081160 RepID=UPI002953D4E7|nr:phosphonatase-like hydrolase [Arthrobacter sp. B10-11]MDV8148004.1 phosphonatase-like hydrolase [Arthrobacter sp. B10-11]